MNPKKEPKFKKEVWRRGNNDEIYEVHNGVKPNKFSKYPSFKWPPSKNAGERSGMEGL